MRTFIPKTPKPTAAQEREAYRIATDRDENRCQFQGWECFGAVQRDHRKNRSQGGPTVPSNLQCLCLFHHDQKTNQPAWAWANGWAVPGHAKPADYPARRWLPTGFGTLRLAWVLYDDAGSWEEINEDRARELGKGLIP